MSWTPTSSVLGDEIYCNVDGSALVWHHLHVSGLELTQGLSVRPHCAPDSASIYRVDLHRLGQKVLVRLSQENPIGTVVIERHIQLGSIEEMISAAPRLVDALVHRKSIASTADVDHHIPQAPIGYISQRS